MTAPAFNGTFPHSWTAAILPSRPMIMPSRHYIYPQNVEEIELGALEILIQPHDRSMLPFLATCALGFRDAATPTGIWSMPHQDWLCAIAGGYAYLIDTMDPRQFTMIRYRPVLDVLCYQPETQDNLLNRLENQSKLLLLFIGHQSILAWGHNGEVWESDRLSWEGITETRIEGSILHGLGWDLLSDKDLPFALDLATGTKL